ncbi:MAG TPA: PDZ domain-containing protein, partial [Gemmataceae bacterium]|nr:PDZ domain-containing protein [Gemmataceae bacterium]
LLALAVVPGQAADPPSPRDRRIHDLEKQIEALNKELNELRHTRATAPAPAAADGMLPADWVKALTWRCIGPANMGGRITALAVFEADPCTYWVATASGGLLKTTNNGVTFEHQFDHESTVSIGDVCVAPSNKDIVWIGTGEANPRNSVSYGDGVYKSTDGGKTWKHMGLRRSFQIGKILIHPTNPDTVYVGALGRLYGPNEERGLFKTTDGGNTWQRVLYVDDRTGVIDARMHPADPETLIVAAYERQRDGFDSNEPAKRYGKGSGLWKTTDGGKTFGRLTTGLPACTRGRIGLDWYRKEPGVVVAIIESEKTGKGPIAAMAGGGYLGIQVEETADNRGTRITEVTAGGPAEKAGLRSGDVITRLGDRPIRSFEQLTEAMRRHKPDDTVKVRLLRNALEKEIEVTVGRRPTGRRGSDPNLPFAVGLAGQRENVQDKQGPDGFDYGGVFKSNDGGRTWKRLNSVNPRPMYFSQVRVDPSDDSYLYVLGVSLYRSTNGGKTFRPDGGRGVHPDQHALWIDPKDGRHMIVGCDGGFYVTYDRTANWDQHNDLAIGQFYHVAIDTRRDYRVYGGLQDNGTWGGPSRTRTFTGPVNEDWLSIGAGDGFRCQVDPNDPDQIYFTSQYGNMGRRNLRIGDSASIRPPSPRRQTPYRWNWNTPFLLSHHNSKIFYSAANYVFRSLDRGNNPQIISPEITATKQGTATALAESPKNPNVLYAGTDDGNLWVTKDGGKEWTNVSKNVGLPGPRWVASIEASTYEEGRAYVVFDAHRSDDDEPYVFATEDFGKSWKSLRANLPWGSTRVLREDIDNPNLLFLGTEFAAWASLDRGQSWTKINNNLPTVAIHEFAIHPTAGEVVVATHGRSLWVCDVSALRQITPEARRAAAFLYKPTSVIRWRREPRHGRSGRRFVGENPASGATIYYSLRRKAETANLRIVDIEGKTVRELHADTEPGLHTVNWNLAGQPPRPLTGQAPGPEARRPSRPGGGGGLGGRPVPAGSYKIVLTVDGREHVQSIRVEGDPAAPLDRLAEEEDDIDDDN